VDAYCAAGSPSTGSIAAVAGPGAVVQRSSVPASDFVFVSVSGLVDVHYIWNQWHSPYSNCYAEGKEEWHSHWALAVDASTS